MVNVVDKMCNQDGCKKIPCFNYDGEKKGLYCSIHKLENMINVKDKPCNFIGCKLFPCYNYKGNGKGKYCKEHKLENMIDVVHKYCVFDGCKIISSYNHKNEKESIYCNTHKKEGMVNVKHISCKNDWCITLVNEKYDGYCLFCYVNMFPDKPVSRNYKTKEFTVVDYIKTKYCNVDWITDKIIKDGCSRRRPDLLLDLGYQVLIIEVDENQHSGYDCSCENKRLMELSQDVGHRPIIFIRFNPDDYMCGDKNITSCWGIDKKGMVIIKKSKKKEWQERLDSLLDQVDYWMNINNKTNKTIEVIELFYDK